MTNTLRKLVFLILVLAVAIPGTAFSTSAANSINSPSAALSFTILHTNDFHGQLEWKSGGSSSNPGSARISQVVNDVRTAVGDANVLLLDAGDEMQGSLLSNLWYGQPVIDVFNTMGYDAATFGNHEFDWGQTVLNDRVTQAQYPYVSANIVSGTCDAANWASPSFAIPYTVQLVGTAPNQVRVGIIGVTTTETPTITIASATAGLCFKDPAESILHYYDELKAQADVIVVLSHLGFNDGGYGYGIPVYGDKTLAQKLIDAGKPANLIIGGHSHTDMGPVVQSNPPVSPTPTPANYVVVGSKTPVVQAYYNGRRVGRADLTFDPATGAVTVNWQNLIINSASAADPVIDALVLSYANDPAYQAKINQPIGYVQTDLLRNYNGDSMMGNFVDDAIYNSLNNDGDAANDVDMFFNNPGGIRVDWCDKEDPANPGTYIWSSTAADCTGPGIWSHGPMLLNYGQMFSILPFGNATVVGEMTGAQILELLNQAGSLNKGAIQPAGMRYTFYHYKSGSPLRAYAWGAWDACVVNKSTGVCEPLDLQRKYKVGTNEFLAPAGGDNFSAFKYMVNVTYWGDMLDDVNSWVIANFSQANPYKGPNGDGMLDGRITRDGNDTSGSIIPITVLHHNDSHGRLNKTSSVGYTQLATLINQERAYNPNRTILLTAGDNIQGDSMMYYFRTAPQGHASDGTALPVDMQINPLIKAFNAMNYDAYTLGNHEFNFGNTVFTSTLAQANMPILQANLTDDGQYGLDQVPVLPYVEKSVGPEGIKVAILGIGNHRIPNYELPSNIPGLTFTDPLVKAQELSDQLRGTNDVLLALTHIGFTENPSSVEVDKNVDTTMAAQTTGLDVIIGGHSHTDPSKQTSSSGAYKYLPTVVAGPGNSPVMVSQAYRYNTYLGEVFIGVRPKTGGGYEVVTRAGQYLSVATSVTEDPTIKAIVDPYVTMLNTYNNTVVGQTTVPIDTLLAFTQETNGANLQADSSVFELASNGMAPDFHLSGAMTNAKIADTATEAAPYTLLVSDMFKAMPYENSLVVLNMNGPQIKRVLERAYRNYYYYKYVPGYGGYSYYTTCMLGINKNGQIVYNDLYPAPFDPTKNYVVSLTFDGHEVDFEDASTYYRVSTVNYLAAGSCNFNDGGVSLWPLDQIANDTQYYVRDAVINYVSDQGIVSPQIEGRLQFIYDVDAPAITINSPEAKTYLHTDFLTIDFDVVDVGPAGLHSVQADLDGVPVTDGQVIDLLYLALGDHTLTVNAVDKATNASSASVTFSVEATLESLRAATTRFYQEGQIDRPALYNGLIRRITVAEYDLQVGKVDQAILSLSAYIYAVETQSGRHITEEAAAILAADARWVIDSLIATSSPEALGLTKFGLLHFLPYIGR